MSICLKDEEFIDHLFLGCEVASAAWFGSDFTLPTEFLEPPLICSWITS